MAPYSIKDEIFTLVGALSGGWLSGMKLSGRETLISGKELFQGKDYSTLQLVQIFFETSSFDDIERDKKIKYEGQLSLIGGTMGLLTGFSIISGIETIYFIVRLTWSFQIPKRLINSS